MQSIAAIILFSLHLVLTTTDARPLGMVSTTRDIRYAIDRDR